MESILKQAIQLRRNGDTNRAIQLLKTDIENGNPDPNVLHFTGLLIATTDNLTEAKKYLKQSVLEAPENAEFWFGYGDLLLRLDDLQDAEVALTNCVQINPKHTKAWVALIYCFQNLNQMEKAVFAGESAVASDPTDKKAWLTYLGALGYHHQYAKALERSKEALVHIPNDWELFHMIGNILTASGKDEEGYQWYLKAYELEKESPELLNSIGLHYSRFERPWDAIPCHNKALELKPGDLYAHHCLGFAYLKAGYPKDACDHLLKATEGGYKNKDCHDSLLMALQYLDGISESQIYEFHIQWPNLYAPQDGKPKKPLQLGDSSSLRVGFVSADLHEHSVARFMSCLIANIPEDIEIYLYSPSSGTHERTKFLMSLGGNWVFCRDDTEQEMAEKISDNQIDVLIDLSGHTGNHRLGVFARKPAPVQISWLGYPNTTGLQSIDYRFSDDIADPLGEADQFSSEKLVRLPDGFHCFEPPIQLPEVGDLPALKNGYITFGCFNNQAKISPLTVKRWSLLLSTFPNSRLILKNKQLRESQNQKIWKSLLRQNDIPLDRVEFFGYTPSLENHYRMYQKVDIALDTFPYNGTTTTCEALWMGVPVLTILGNSQRSRTSASLLTHVEIPEWIAQNEEDWLRIPKQWTCKLQELNHLRYRLRENCTKSPIGDGQKFSRKFYQTVRRLHSEHTSTAP